MLNNLFEIEKYYPEVKYDLTKPQTIKIRKISNLKAVKLINFKPKYSLSEGLNKTLQWYKSYE